MIERLRELKKAMTREKYYLLMKIVMEDVSFHRSIGTKFTEDNLINLINNSYMVISRIYYLARK